MDTSVFDELCRTGNSELVKQYLETNSTVANSTTAIGIGFDICCYSNLDTAKLLYDNYKEACNIHINTTVFFAGNLLTMNNIEALLWLKSLNNEFFINQIDYLFITLINERNIECKEFKLLYEHFYDRFEYLGTTIQK